MVLVLAQLLQTVGQPPPVQVVVRLLVVAALHNAPETLAVILAFLGILVAAARAVPVHTTPAGPAGSAVKVVKAS
ncbi:hypothetical protein [Pseudomonas umsongensis]|uniref:Uncharacterized protein n=1 Tax=Pseudomonas umsongensis TaxID=198618 RepID=A0AAE6ZV59_9PSED|nr:hypothetical protein [Pseudomonas umsongensis]QJC78904.1 hypothetical protein HGP31_11475 [Pseudomonas umsongensis]